ncbi:MAG: protein-glutamate O-methyltransferase CheR [Proteobacteria bacterium]|nr:protein-glutamate O-methyltransferase CheR [Pseudomonadota bacterium]
MWNISGGPQLSNEEFINLRNFIKEKCGIFFDENSKYILEKRLSSRLVDLKIESFKEYLFFLKFDKRREEELLLIYDILTTNETYFFREEYQLKAFSDEILPEILSKKGDSKSLRIWSAGCSTGEEAYTIAMILYNKKDIMENYKINIFASDISQRCLKIAREGVYGQNSFRGEKDDYKNIFFTLTEDKKYRIKDEIKRLVSFGHLNLLDKRQIAMLPSMDIVFCRNVLIYFDNESRKIVIDNFYNKLTNGGFLLLGHAESLINVSTAFIMRHLKNDLVYQKP